MPPAVSVIIVAYESAETLPRCLTALNHQSFRDFEIILIDNASKDGGPDEAALPENARLIRNPDNLGFAAACNQGAREARGRWLAMLNPDAFAAPSWLEALMAAAEAHPAYRMLGSLQLMADDPDIMDGTGDVYHVSGLAWRGGHGKSAAIAPLQAREIFGPCGAAALYDREMFLAAGGYDSRYFCYFEDVDLALRLRLSGEKALIAPEAVVRHVGSASSGGPGSPFAVYHGLRNLTWTFWRGTPLLAMPLAVPWHGALILALFTRYAVTGRFAAAGRAVRALRDAYRGLAPFWAERADWQTQGSFRRWAEAVSFSLTAPFLRAISDKAPEAD